MEWITYTGIIVGSALIAITIDWLVRRRRRRPTIEFSGAGTDACPGLGIADSGHDMLLGFILGELNADEMQRTLGHLQTCTPCAEKLRVVVTLHCGQMEADADGVVRVTPEKLRQLRGQAGDTVQ